MVNYKYFLFTILLCTFLQTKSKAQVVNWIDTVSQDMGTIPIKEVTTTSFRFINTFSDSIYFDNIRPQCGCTSAIGWERIKVAPLDTGRLVLEMKPFNNGYFYKKIKVFFNAQKQAEILFIEGVAE